MAEEQYAGRGQQSNRWVSEPGKNLTCSVLFNPSFLVPSQQFLLNQAISLAVTDMLMQLTGRAFVIKWPNDIYFESLKVGGLLIENILSGQTWKHAIVGIGLNVNQHVFPDALQRATSLAKILQRDYNLELVLTELCRYLEAWYLRLRAGHEKAIESAYLSRLLGYGEIRPFRTPGDGLFDGTLTGVNKAGKLMISAQGETRHFDLKEIEFVL